MWVARWKLARSTTRAWQFICFLGHFCAGRGECFTVTSTEDGERQFGAGCHGERTAEPPQASRSGTALTAYWPKVCTKSPTGWPMYVEKRAALTCLAIIICDWSILKFCSSMSIGWTDLELLTLTNSRKMAGLKFPSLLDWFFSIAKPPKIYIRCFGSRDLGAQVPRQVAGAVARRQCSKTKFCQLPIESGKRGINFMLKA